MSANPHADLLKKDFHPTEQINGAELYIARKLTPYWDLPIFQLNAEQTWSVQPQF